LPCAGAALSLYFMKGKNAQKYYSLDCFTADLH